MNKKSTNYLSVGVNGLLLDKICKFYGVVSVYATIAMKGKTLKWILFGEILLTAIYGMKVSVDTKGLKTFQN